MLRTSPVHRKRTGPTSEDKIMFQAVSEEGAKNAYTECNTQVGTLLAKLLSTKLKSFGLPSHHNEFVKPFNGNLK